MIEKSIIDEYLTIKGWSTLDLNDFEIIDIKKTDKERFTAIENGLFDSETMIGKYEDLKTLSTDGLKEAIEYLKVRENRTNPNNGVKFITIKRIEAEDLLNNLQIMM